MVDDDGFIAHFNVDPAFAEAIASAASMEDAVALARLHGFSITPEALIRAAEPKPEGTRAQSLRASGESPQTPWGANFGDY